MISIHVAWIQCKAIEPGNWIIFLHKCKYLRIVWSTTDGHDNKQYKKETFSFPFQNTLFFSNWWVMQKNGLALTWASVMTSKWSFWTVMSVCFKRTYLIYINVYWSTHAQYHHHHISFNCQHNTNAEEKIAININCFVRIDNLEWGSGWCIKKIERIYNSVDLTCWYNLIWPGLTFTWTRQLIHLKKIIFLYWIFNSVFWSLSG